MDKLKSFVWVCWKRSGFLGEFFSRNMKSNQNIQMFLLLWNDMIVTNRLAQFLFK